MNRPLEEKLVKIAAVVLNYNSSADCQNCISGLKRQVGIDLEIVVVDNCSSTEDQVAVEKLCHETNCTFLRSPRNGGYNAGNNIGLRYAAQKGCEYALICNPDMEFPQADYLSCLIEVLQGNPKIAVAATDILHQDGYHQNPIAPDGNWKEEIKGLYTLIRPRRKSAAPDFIDHSETSHFCAKVSGCCFLIRLDFLQSIGFLDEHPFLYCEEAILASQVRQAGLSMYYDATRQAIHRHISKSKGDPLKRFEYFRQSRSYFIQRYSTDIWPCRMLALVAWNLKMRLMQCFLLFRKWRGKN